jgi:hypothetical protein
MKAKLDQYNLELQEVLIGTPMPGKGGGQNASASGGTMGTGNVLEGLLAILLSEKIGIESNATVAPSSPEAQAMRDEMRTRIAPSATTK